jgi:hypothetical protein
VLLVLASALLGRVADGSDGVDLTPKSVGPGGAGKLREVFGVFAETAII